MKRNGRLTGCMYQEGTRTVEERLQRHFQERLDRTEDNHKKSSRPSGCLEQDARSSQKDEEKMPYCFLREKIKMAERPAPIGHLHHQQNKKKLQHQKQRTKESTHL